MAAAASDTVGSHQNHHQNYRRPPRLPETIPLCCLRSSKSSLQSKTHKNLPKLRSKASNPGDESPYSELYSLSRVTQEGVWVFLRVCGEIGVLEERRKSLLSFESEVLKESERIQDELLRVMRRVDDSVKVRVYGRCEVSLSVNMS
ncbi:abnormal spindle-like microcephaly-associated protein [Corchorus olitorius]|uniref:Abnormal spindle-like microcephaly-associated protein n=1 Tax=Corchorus olitorius TaxID=93759 RepID=A0A1R3JVH9_9ROSI|nr:abnormal spindle-like microcephaly-associated protein [Corchorus olitorius]